MEKWLDDPCWRRWVYIMFRRHDGVRLILNDQRTGYDIYMRIDGTYFDLDMAIEQTDYWNLLISDMQKEKTDAADE